MNTPAHLLVGVALCSRGHLPRTGKMAALGSLLPDVSLYLMAGVSLFLLRIPPERVFGELYFSNSWQSVFAVDNSFLVWGIVLLVAVLMRSMPAVALSCAGLLHIASDFALHNDDARPHFWPLSDWVFESPISYWDSQHHAGLVAPFTLIVVLISAFVILRRWKDLRVRFAVLTVCCLEVWVVRQWLLFF